MNRMRRKWLDSASRAWAIGQARRPLAGAKADLGNTVTTFSERRGDRYRTDYIQSTGEPGRHAANSVLPAARFGK
jgi:hypothetical protein